VCACSSLYTLGGFVYGLPTTFLSVLRGRVHVLTCLFSQFTNEPQCNQRCPVLCIMYFLDFSYVSFISNLGIGQLCEDLNTIIGQAIWYDTFQILNTRWLWLVNDLVTTPNSDNVLCGTFWLYPSYVAGNLNSVKQINFYVLCNKRINYGKHIRTCIAGKECTFKLLARNSFLITSGCDSSTII
jgi:hypothetical protein